MRVRFLVDDNPFKKGEVRELPYAEATKLIQHGVAVMVEEDMDEEEGALGVGV